MRALTFWRGSKQSDEASSVELNIHKHQNLSRHPADMPEPGIDNGIDVDSSRDVEAWRVWWLWPDCLYIPKIPRLLLDEESSADFLYWFSGSHSQSGVEDLLYCRHDMRWWWEINQPLD